MSNAVSGSQSRRCTHHGGDRPKLDRNRQRHDESADDEDQEGGRPVADVEGMKIEPAGAAARRECGESREQRRVTAARAAAAQGGG